MDQHDEERLSEGARALIDAARGAETAAADAHRTRMKRAVMANVVALGVGASAAAHGGLAAWLSGTAAKTTVVLALVGAGAGVAYNAHRDGRTSVAATAVLAPVPPLVRPAAVTVPAAPASSALPAPAAVTAPPVRASERPRVRARAPAPVARPAPNVVTPSALAEETRLIAEAHAAIRQHEGARALATLATYRTRFPTGALREEHFAATVFALEASGKRAAACVQARAFLAQWPRSPQAARIRNVCKNS